MFFFYYLLCDFIKCSSLASVFSTQYHVWRPKVLWEIIKKDMSEDNIDPMLTFCTVLPTFKVEVSVDNKVIAPRTYWMKLRVAAK